MSTNISRDELLEILAGIHDERFGEAVYKLVSAVRERSPRTVRSDIPVSGGTIKRRYEELLTRKKEGARVPGLAECLQLVVERPELTWTILSISDEETYGRVLLGENDTRGCFSYQFQAPRKLSREETKAILGKLKDARFSEPVSTLSGRLEETDPVTITSSDSLIPTTELFGIYRHRLHHGEEISLHIPGLREFVEVLGSTPDTVKWKIITIEALTNGGGVLFVTADDEPRACLAYSERAPLYEPPA